MDSLELMKGIIRYTLVLLIGIDPMFECTFLSQKQGSFDLSMFFIVLLILITITRFCYREYLENIRKVDEGIKNAVKLIEDFYSNDKKTAFVFTSDHGMTNWGGY